MKKLILAACACVVALAACAKSCVGDQFTVAYGLRWLARHQCPDGSWSFDLSASSEDCDCTGSGTFAKSTNAATALGLLPFLGAGITHQEEHRMGYDVNVRKGLEFLCRNMKEERQVAGKSLRQNEGTMYAHGLAAICLTEAYAMTKDETLRAPAQAALDFIMDAQDPMSGGWRYVPRQAGDTSVTGWQVMALRSGEMGGLTVDPQTFARTLGFLDSVQTDDGAFYGYTAPGKSPACTAIGMMCRMYCGAWGEEEPALKRGLGYLSETGPSEDNLYYNYFATLVLRQNAHVEGEKWMKWITKIRDPLDDSQCRDETSHEFGSWPPEGEAYGQMGGRLYATSMAIMTLEVYYRHLPLYSTDSWALPGEPRVWEDEEMVEEEEEEEEEDEEDESFGE